jgi:formate--tetrahydrofolate ligase
MKSDIQICRDTALTPIDQIAQMAGIEPQDLTPQGTLKA